MTSQTGPEVPDPSEVTSTIALPGAEPGEEQPVEPGAGPEHADGLPAGAGLLVVQRGPNAGSRFILEAEVVTVGRHHESDIFLDDVTVSRRHAQFRRDPEGYRVRDVGSLNGTYVNRRRIDDVLLAGGDEVQIGKYRLLYLTGRGSGPSGVVG
ncbi:MAG: FHA domain-containing protein [Actinomycetia bacterium]|jgi:pSer/pThr/pTyr-binding forkhead associated (FHA) protein|nr:FHA domain-containing protein [Actinomycetes bacterium]